MSLWKHGWKVCLCLLLGGAALAEEAPPASLTFFGLYGTPVQPLGLAAAVTNGFGLNILGEWNPSYYVSLGLSYERVGFYGSEGFTYPALNFESRFFPLQNGKGRFSPYLYGGAGLGLSTGSAPVLKAGIGSRVSISGPWFFDLAAGSHWVQSPDNFQYVDFRVGLSYFIGYTPPPPTPTPTPVPTVTLPSAVPSPTPTVNVTSTPVTLIVTATPTVTPVVIPGAVTTLAQGLRYYRKGIKAYGVENFRLSLIYLKKSLELRAKRKHASYYAQAYAYIGAIYQFHAHTVKDHLQKALDNYKKALAVDRKNKIARKYYRKLKAQVARMAKPKPGLTPVPTSESVPPTTSSVPTAVPSSPAQAITLSN